MEILEALFNYFFLGNDMTWRLKLFLRKMSIILNNFEDNCLLAKEKILLQLHPLIIQRR